MVCCIYVLYHAIYMLFYSLYICAKNITLVSNVYIHNHMLVACSI
ncbi:hypothetical protein AO385_1995 [Moraxella catarrhalis]|uniref:Uncharacterized protein n=1 Tax=Moraxella catarrhalis TaxID=480 RepID=A0A198UH78_MORCA|nr:hypothetical protein AO384_1934 [Moraxella catarrhalis]OAU95571.1 hypothetical protein AO385_1995 [Moraxella catarrhalis]OAU96819.1 hypothetical protein AO383_1336 [Moraxella catarrhalis]OAV28918.1 hypothetical protein AO369_0301 [Moraxella catarrhalis]